MTIGRKNLEVLTEVLLDGFCFSWGLYDYEVLAHAWAPLNGARSSSKQVEKSSNEPNLDFRRTPNLPCGRRLVPARVG